MTNTIEIENLNISDLDIPTDETLQEVATACENIATSSESIATSCDNVATSCDNVATSCGDLAKDTTLQSTNTALGSLATDATLQATNTALGGLNTSVGGIIKDATLQATNTALAGLLADTTGQSIASAISGLGATLGSDKANISGDNIANPSAFRQNIEASKVSVTDVNVSGTTSATGYYVTPYDFNEYFIGGRIFIRGESGCYAIFRPSAQNKVVIMVLDDTLNRRINTAIEGKLYYLAIT